MAIDPIIKKKADDIRNKVYGKEVRESLASGLEEMSSDVVENEGRQSVVEGRQDSVESQWQAVSDEMTDKDVISAPEIIAARNGAANLKTRLDEEHQEVTTQLAHNEQELINTVLKVGDYPINAMHFEGGLLNEIYERGVNIEWFGANSDYDDNTPYTQLAFDYIINNNVTLFIPEKTYKHTGEINLTANTSKASIGLLVRGLSTRSQLTFSGERFFVFNDKAKTLNFSSFNDVYIGSTSASGMATAFYVVARWFSYNHFNNVEIRNCNVFDISGCGWINTFTKCMFFSNVLNTSTFRFSEVEGIRPYFSAFTVSQTTIVSPSAKILINKNIELDVFNLIDTVIEGNGSAISYSGGESTININNCYIDGTTTVFALPYLTGDLTLNIDNSRIWQTKLSQSYLNLYSDTNKIYLNINNNKFEGEPQEGSFYINNYPRTIISGKGNHFEHPNVALRSNRGLELSSIKELDGLGLDSGDYIRDGVYWLAPAPNPPSGSQAVVGRRIKNSSPQTVGEYVKEWVRISDGWVGEKVQTSYYTPS